MTELIPHEVQISAIDGGHRHQSDHLMQGDAALGDIIHILLCKVPVHIGINQSEDNRLITHKGLIMTLAV